jgi:hypothetical protein
MRKSLPVLAVAAAMLTAACADADGPEPMAASLPPQEGKECFWLSQVNGFTDAGRNRVNVHTGPSEVYEFETMGSCPELPYTEDLAFDQTGPGQICRGIDVTLIVPSAIGPQRCPVRMIRKLSEAEARAR